MEYFNFEETPHIIENTRQYKAHIGGCDIHVAYICSDFDDDFMEDIPAKRQNTIKAFRNKRDRDLMLTGDILAHKFLPKSNVCTVGKNGKPFLPNCTSIHFNKSHSGSVAVLAVAKVPVGIDVQQHRNTNCLAIAKRHFSLPEIECMNSATNKKSCFFDIWCKKESYLKMTGTGINRNLSCIDYGDCRFFFSNFFEGYSLCLCLPPS